MLLLMSFLVFHTQAAAPSSPATDEGHDPTKSFRETVRAMNSIARRRAATAQHRRLGNTPVADDTPFVESHNPGQHQGSRRRLGESKKTLIALTKTHIPSTILAELQAEQGKTKLRHKLIRILGTKVNETVHKDKQEKYDFEGKIGKIKQLQHGWIRNDARDAEIRTLVDQLEAKAFPSGEHVVLMFAMQEEADPTIQAYKLVEDHKIFKTMYPKIRCRVFKGKAGSLNLTVVCNGRDKLFLPAGWEETVVDGQPSFYVNKSDKPWTSPDGTKVPHGEGTYTRPHSNMDNVAMTPAAMVATLVCTMLRPDLVINVGLAGGWEKRGGAVNNIFIPDRVQNHDRRIPFGWEDYGIGLLTVPCGRALREENKTWKAGLCSTGNSFTASPKEEEFFEKHKPDVKEMEFAAIAWVCVQFDMKYFALKAITDLDDKPNNFQAFLKNKRRLSDKLRDAVEIALCYIAKNGVTAVVN